jgi:hypothetical protein
MLANLAVSGENRRIRTRIGSERCHLQNKNRHYLRFFFSIIIVVNKQMISKNRRVTAQFIATLFSVSGEVTIIQIHLTMPVAQKIYVNITSEVPEISLSNSRKISPVDKIRLKSATRMLNEG